VRLNLIFAGFLFLFIYISLGDLVSGETITGETILTGDATNADIGIGITITGAPPSVQITSPLNGTYINSFIQLEYITTGTVNATWYNLDGGVNISVSGAVSFLVSEGSHTIKLYANNSDGTSSDSVSFIVNSSLLSIDYDEFIGSTSGDSTDFDSYTYGELQNLSGIVLENTDNGKIEFNRSVNVVGSASGGVVRIDDYVEVADKNINLDISGLPTFNVQSTLTFYNLDLTNIQILVNGALCVPSICDLVSYSGGTLIFTVTQLGNYVIQESNGTGTGDGGDTGGSSGGGSSGGGSSGGTISPSPEIEREVPLPEIVTEDFTINLRRIEATVRVGEVVTKLISITNLRDEEVELTLTDQNLENLLSIPIREITLEPYESREILVDIFAGENMIPNQYFGKILVEGDVGSEEILVAIEVETMQDEFDVSIKIDPEEGDIYPGKKMTAQIELLNRNEGLIEDARVEYFIRTTGGKVIYYENEKRSFDNRTFYMRDFKIPKDTLYGEYALYVRVTHEGEVGGSSVWFDVIKRPLFESKNQVYGLIIFLILLILVVISKLRKKEDKWEKDALKNIKNLKKDKSSKKM